MKKKKNNNKITKPSILTITTKRRQQSDKTAKPFQRYGLANQMQILKYILF